MLQEEPAPSLQPQDLGLHCFLPTFYSTHHLPGDVSRSPVQSLEVVSGCLAKILGSQYAEQGAKRGDADSGWALLHRPLTPVVGVDVAEEGPEWGL